MVPNIKKLTAGFLVFAALATMLSLGFSTLLSSSSSQPTPSATASIESRAGENAFIPKDQAGATSLADGTMPVLGGAPAASTNLTLRLGSLLAQEVIHTNDTLGTLNAPPAGLVAPKKKELETAIQTSLANLSEASTFLPQFDEPITNNALTILAAPRAEDFSRYTDATSRALEETVGSATFEKLLAGKASLETAYAATAMYGNLTQTLALIPVPQPLIGFHKSVIAAVRNRKTLVDVALGDFSDPLKSLATIQSLESRVEEILDRDAENIEREAARVRSISFAAPADTRDILATIFGIERAFAQGAEVPVKDKMLTTTAKSLTGEQKKSNAQNWLRRLWDFTQKVLLQELKNQIIAMLEQQIVNWINGGGKPQFVTDWKGFIGDAFNNAAGAAIDKILPELCMPLNARTYINFTLRPPLIPVYTGCTLNQVINNVKNFANDFRNGGWLQYSVTIQPTGNYFGGLIEAHDAGLFAGLAGSDAAKNKALAGAGFLGSEICPSTGKPPDEEGSLYGYPCPGNEQPITRTPGKVLGDTLTKGLSLPSELIVNANDIAGLVAVVTDAALTRLMAVGLSAAGKATGKGLSDVPPRTATTATNVTAAAAAQKAAADNPIAPPTESDVQNEVAKSVEVGDAGNETFPPAEALASRIDLSNICLLCATQSYTEPRSDGSGPARAAIDGSLSTFSSTFGSSPASWEVALPIPQYLDEIQVQTNAGYPMSKSAGNNGPLLVLYEAGTSPLRRYTITLPNATYSRRINLTTERMRDANGNEVATPPNKIEVAKVRFEASQLLLAEVELFRHMSPEVDISKVPSTLTKAAAANLDPLQWVSAIAYPAHNSAPQPAPLAVITVTITENKERDASRMEPLSQSPLRYGLAPGSYRFIYTATVGGETTAPRTRTVTVTE
ncbi:MAG: hypothetical protein HYY10_02505 [Candidatus Liptonbacteria bacterium]|nr:hypothetical protein [Candidatus Liptonbacteria bacterium]